MEQVRDTLPEPAFVLSKAALRAAKALGLTQQDLGEVVGRHRSKLARGIDPESKEGELAMMLVRCYRALYALMDGNLDQMAHWMRTENRGTGGIPQQQIRKIEGLYRISGARSVAQKPSGR